MLRTRFASLAMMASIATLGPILVPAEAVAQWKDIECSASKIEMPGMKCRQGPSDTGTSGTCSFENFVTFGTKTGVYFNAWVYLTQIPRCWVTPVQPASFEQSMKGNGWIKANGKDFAEVRTFQGGYAMNFTTDKNRKCIAYYQPGTPRGTGYVYIQRGYFCGPLNKDFDDAQLTEQIKSLKVSQ